MVVVVLFVPLNGFIEVDMFILVRTVPSRPISAESPVCQRRSSAPAGQIPASPVDSYFVPAHSPAADAAISSVTHEEFFQPFVKEASSFLYIGICVYIIICSIAINFFQQASAHLVLPDVFDALKVPIPISCIILGRVYASYIVLETSYAC